MMEKPQEKGDYFILTGIFILDNGRMIKLMVKVNTYQEMVLYMRVNGSKIQETVKVNKYG